MKLNKFFFLLLTFHVLRFTPCAYAFREPDREVLAVEEGAPEGVRRDRFLSAPVSGNIQNCSTLITSVKEKLDVPQNLELVGAYFAPGRHALKDMCYILFRQQVGGVSVEGSYLNVSVKDVQGTPRIVGTVSRTFEIPDSLSVAPQSAPQAWYPMAAGALGLDSGGEFVPVSEKQVVGYVGGRWRNLAVLRYAQAPTQAVRLDLATGETFVRQEVLYLDVAGDVKGRGVLFDPPGTGSNLDNMPLADLRVRNVSEGNFSYTDPSGNFVVPSSGTGPVRLLAYVSGRWSNVSADQGMNLLVSSVTAPGNSVTLQFNPIGNTEFDTSQINGYYHTTRIHNWLKERVPSLTGIDIPIPTHVNIYDTCNAYYSLAASIHFFMAGPFGSYNCINTAYDTVVYHEYGHFADDMAGGIVMDTPGVGLSEGWGDVLAALESGQPLIGEGFFGVGATRAYIRTADNTYRFPANGLDETHALGQAWSGFAWHLRQNLIAKYGQAQGIALTEDLVIPVLLANSPDIPSAFKEVILRDDDDGNPNNGTPNFDDIWEAAGRHNLQFAIPSVHIVQQVSPVYGWPGDPVTVTGSGFGPAPGWIAFYQAVLGTPTSWSDTSISVPIPAGAISGPVALHSTQFELDSNPTQFTVLSTPGPTFITVAGGGNLVFDIGDGGGATSATFRSLDIAVDAWGNIYIADADNHSIRKVAFSGVITTVAGNGIAGYSGDGGPATSASLNDPQGVAVDRSGNIYISDTRNQRIRKVDSFGVITTIAGSGVRGYGGDGGPAILAKFNWPKSLYADASGNVYVGDYSNSRIRKIDSSGVITTAAGNGLSGFYGDGGPATSAQIKNPWDVTGDVLGNLYIADTYNGRIRKVDASGIITTVAGNGIAGYSGDGGPATLASLYNPNGVAVDSSGNLYIADTYNRRIRKVEPSGIIRTVAGNGVAASDGDGGPAALARLKSPLTAATRGKEVYVLDGTGRVRWLTSFDQTPPAVTITAPADGALLGDIVTVEAAASDDVGMLGVQFKLDGQNLGSQDTSPPYTISWNTRDVSDKTYTLTAVARDLSDNVAQHSISVVVDNYYRKDQPCLAGGSGYAPSLAKPCVPTYQLEGISVLDFSAQGTGRPALLTPNADGVRDGVGFLGAKSVKILNLEGRVIKTLSGDGSLLIWHPGRDSYSPESGIYMAVDENSRKILPILIVK